MRRLVIAAGCLSICLSVHAERKKPVIDKTGINMGQSYIYNMGAMDLSSSTNDFTDLPWAQYTPSIGLLVGVNPETGQPVTNAVNLLPVMFRSAYVAGTVNAGMFIGSGAGLTNIPSQSLSGYIPMSLMPTSGVWNVDGLTLKNAHFDGPVSVGGQSLNVDSDLTVHGKLSGDASGLTKVPAGGTDGSVQFNSKGQLDGNTNYFVNAKTGKLGFYSKEGNLFRAYRYGIAADTNLIYALRRYRDTTELCLLKNGKETIRLRGDGTAYIAGSLQVDGDITFANGMKAGNNNWYIPQSGDLSMGNYTDGGGLDLAAGEYVPDSTDLSMGSFTSR